MASTESVLRGELAMASNPTRLTLDPYHHQGCPSLDLLLPGQTVWAPN